LELNLANHQTKMTAIQYFEEKHGTLCHTLSKTNIIDLMEGYHVKKSNFEKTKQRFNIEQFINTVQEKKNKGTENKMQGIP
jgi:hypothetical protein